MSDLLDRIADPLNLSAAWSRIRSARAGGGSDGVQIDDFNAVAERELERLRDELLAESYVPAPLLEIRIAKGNGKSGERILHLPAVRDKIAQQATRLVLEPAVESTFLDCSYGYRAGKGPGRAIARVSHYISHMKRRWVVAGDVDDCFDSIAQDRLARALEARVHDARVIRLVSLWCAMGAVTSSGKWRDAIAGVHQGNVVAPLLANLYLHAFDETLVAADCALVRYADDFVVLERDQAAAERAAAAARDSLAALGLRLNDDACVVRPIDSGFTFLGIHFRGHRRHIDPAKLDAARTRVAEVARTVPRVGLAAAVKDLNTMVTGWRRYYATVLSVDELSALAAVVDDALTALAKAGLDVGLSHGAVEESLAFADSLIPVSNEERRRRARRAVRRDDPTVDHAASAAVARRPGTAPTPVATAVRDKKRRHLRAAETGATLLVNTAGSFIGKSAHSIVVRKDRREVARVTVNRLRAVTVASRGVSLSDDAIDLCAHHKVPVVFLSPWGEVRAIVTSPWSLDADLIIHQCAASSTPERAAPLAAAIVEGKIKNQQRLARYWGKYHRIATAGFAALLETHDTVVSDVLEKLPSAAVEGTLEDRRSRLMGLEGRAATTYWPLVAAVLGAKQAFAGRERQGARDLVNCLLNYGYAILQSRVHVALLQAGLIPEVGFLHAARRRSTVLVFDLMEEFRAPIVDRAVISLLSLRKPAEQDPDRLLTRETRSLIVDAVSNRLGSLVRYDGRDLTLTEVVEHQARRLARAIIDDEPYRPFASTW